MSSNEKIDILKTVLLVAFIFVDIGSPSVVIREPQLYEDPSFHDASLNLFRSKRSLRDKIGYPCLCEGNTCECCIFIYTTTQPAFEREVCFNSTLYAAQPYVKVDMFFDQDHILTHNLTKQLRNCISQQANPTLRFCIDFKQVRYDSKMFHFCINLQMFHHEHFSIVYFRCLDMSRVIESV